MISSVSSLSSSSISLLFGTSNTSATAPATSATTLLGDVTGHTDDVLKAGNAIGNIIEIVSRMNEDAASAGKKIEVEELDLPNDKGRKLNEFDRELLYGLKGTFTTTHHGNGERTETFVGSFTGMTDEAYRQMTINSLKQDQSTLRNQTWLAAYENGTIQESDIAELGFNTGAVRTTDYYSDGSATDRTHIDTSGIAQFREQYTEMKDGVLYDKASGKFASIGQNGSKFIYSTW